MNQSGIELLLEGKPLGGVLRLRCEETVESVAGTIQLIENQVVLTFTVEPMSRLAATISRGHVLVVNGEEVLPLAFSQMAIFDSRLGSMTLIQLGEPEVLSHNLTHPLECRLRPRFTVLDRVDEPYWCRPTIAMAEIGGLAAWMHDGRVTRSGTLNCGEAVGGIKNCSLSYRDFGEKAFHFGDSSSTVTVRSHQTVNRSDNRDELAIRFRSVAIVEWTNETSWTQALETIDAIQELINLLTWSNQQWRFLHCKFGRPTEVDYEFWESTATSPPPELPEPWSRTLTARSRDDIQATSRELRFVMPMSELTDGSIDQWFRIREEYSEGLRLILQVIKSPTMAPEVRALQLGTGIERLGFRSLEAKTNSNKANVAFNVKRFEEIADEAVRLFPEAFEEWAVKANNNYQAMKHLKRKRPTVRELARTNDLTVLVVQIWLAKRLGASDSNLKTQILESWRFKSDYSPIPDPSELP